MAHSRTSSAASSRRRSRSQAAARDQRRRALRGADRAPGAKSFRGRRDGLRHLSRGRGGRVRDEPVGVSGVGGAHFLAGTGPRRRSLTGTVSGSSRSTRASASESCARTLARRSSSTGSLVNAGSFGNAPTLTLRG